MAVFEIKYRDTGRALRVRLTVPDPNDATGRRRIPFDLTGATAQKLHVRLNTGDVVTRDMAVVGAPTDGVLEYQWQPADWGVGAIVAGPELPLSPGETEHVMEYEVIGPASARNTFPTGGYDTLRVTPDLGQG